MSSLKTLRARLLVECLNLPRASGVEDAKWEHFQLSHLNNDSVFRIETKSRQIAWSWLSAAEAVAEAVLDARSSLFISINLDEAKEKIRYAHAVYENFEGVTLPKLVKESALELEFSNGARLVSMPSKAPRGKPRFNVYADEFAHVQRDRQIYTGMLPVISKGGRMRIGSSPLGASGVFWEIATQAMRPYPGYTRKSTPWWEVQAFCLNVSEARKLAPALATAERVELFGNDRIKALYSNMLLEDFQQEYEATFVDETTAWISWDEIRANQDPELLCALATMRGSKADEVFAAIEQVARWIQENKVEAVLYAGVDVGRTRNTTEIFLIGLTTTGSRPLRLALTLDGVEFDDQEAVLVRVLKTLPVAHMLIDRTGIGRNLAENVSRAFSSKVQGVDFTAALKQLWATDMKMLMQQRKVPLPSERDIAYQIHSIKRLVTPSKNLVFDTERNEKHHADKFWALALACNGTTAAKPILSVGEASAVPQPAQPSGRDAILAAVMRRLKNGS